MPVTTLSQLHIKVGTKDKYTANKASLDSTNTLALTPLASEFASNTTAGKGQFTVSGTPITTLAGTVGTATRPVYLSSGTITQGTYTLGATINAGTSGNLAYYSGANAISSYNSDVGSGVKPIYLATGTPTASSSTVGAAAHPVYLSSGTITGCSSTVGSAGSSTGAATPVYMNAGVITACSVAVPIDKSITTSASYPVYTANDSTAGSISQINFSTRFQWNPGARTFTIMSAANTTDNFTFGLEKVETW